MGDATREAGPGVRLLLIGAPGSGKGTQGRLLAAHFGVRHISSGDLLRDAARGDGEVAEALRAAMASGDLVPDDVVLAVVGPAVVQAAAEGGYVLDGFPRTVPQAERAYELARARGVQVHAVVFLDVDDDEVVERLARRAREEGRKDDDPSVVRHRLEVYREQTEPLLAFYDERGRLVRVDGSGPPAEVTASILDALAARAIDAAAR